MTTERIGRVIESVDSSGVATLASDCSSKVECLGGKCPETDQGQMFFFDDHFLPSAYVVVARARPNGHTIESLLKEMEVSLLNRIAVVMLSLGELSDEGESSYQAIIDLKKWGIKGPETCAKAGIKLGESPDEISMIALIAKPQ